jgi:hypothetical protein
MARRRSVEEIKQLLESYRASGMTRIEYCGQAGIALSTLGRYLRRHGGTDQGLIRVRLRSAPEPDRGFVLVLGNGRRIESGWCFGDGELARLIRVAEAV